MPVGIPRRHSGWQRRLAAVLLVVQVAAGTAVSLAHATEATRGSVRFEARHTAQCVVLHDTARCAQCQFDATRMVAPTTRQAEWSSTAGLRFPSSLTAGLAPTLIHLGATHPRAPPLTLS